MGTALLEKVWPQWQAEEKPLGKGSYGTVYKAVRRENDVESHAAIKVISIPTDSSEIESLRSEGYNLNQTRDYLQGVVKDFVSEIQLMESVKGVQNIVSVEDYKVVEKTDEIGWDIFIRMELLKPFNAYITEHKMTEAEVIKLGCDICTALEVCGKRNIIHRDIKPENIFINDFGDYKLGDFGIARKMDNLTGSLSQKGTYNYMAPEVISGTDYDGRVDTYSLGIVLYRLLNGNRLPFLNGDNLNPNERKLAVDRRIRGEELPAPCEASKPMAHLILRACAFHPGGRFASATEMKQALLAVANGTYRPVAVDTMDKTVAARKAPAQNPVQPAAHTANGTKAAPKQPVSQPAKKKKSKLPLILVLILVLTLVVVGVVWYISSMGGDIPGLSIGGSAEQKEIQSIIEDADQLAQDENYEDAYAAIQEGMEEYPDDAALKQKAEEYAAAITKQQIDAVLEEADKLAVEENYSGAIAVLDEGLKIYPDSEELKNQRQEYTTAQVAQEKENILSEAAALAELEDYAGAIGVLKKALETSPEDADFQAACDGYYQSMKAAAISDAEELAKAEDYISAIELLNGVTDIMGEDAELAAKATAYEVTYVQNVSEQVETYLAENNFTAAQKLLQTATQALPDNTELAELYTEISGYKTVLLNNLSPINGGFTWNEGTPGDPFESDYSTVKNYTIYHGNTCWISYDTSAEFKIDQQYDILRFNISPYSEYGETAISYVQVYVDNVLRYVSPAITQKSGITNVEVDIHNATYLKIVIRKGENGCIMLSDAELSSVPGYVSGYESGVTSVATLKPINGGFTWDSGVPTNIMNDSYVKAANYTIYHGNSCWISYNASAEYYLAGKYESVSLDMAPYGDFGQDARSVVKIYVDDVLVYTGGITQKSAKTNTGEIDLTDAKYLKIVIEKSDYGCVIISDVLLKNAE